MPFYRGHEKFNEVLTDKRLSKVGRVIRAYNYGGPSGNEKLYVIGTEEQLFDAQTRKKVEAKDVLSNKAAPDGWSVETFGLELLPESEIEKIVTDPTLI